MRHVLINLLGEMLKKLIHLLGTRMNTDYQDIKSYKKPIIHISFISTRKLFNEVCYL
jgi:hypothetical protein